MATRDGGPGAFLRRSKFGCPPSVRDRAPRSRIVCGSRSAWCVVRVGSAVPAPNPSDRRKARAAGRHLPENRGMVHKLAEPKRVRAARYVARGPRVATGKFVSALVSAMVDSAVVESRAMQRAPEVVVGAVLASVAKRLVNVAVEAPAQVIRTLLANKSLFYI